MINVKTEVKGKNLIITINLKKTFGRSKSGKTITVASTKGNKAIKDTDVILGLNCYKKPEDEAEAEDD